MEIIYYTLAAFAGFCLGAVVFGAAGNVRLAHARAAAVRIQAQLDVLMSAKQEMSNQFQALAAAILEHHSQKFSQQNHEALGTLLAPLGERIADFHQRMDAVHKTDIEQRSALKQQVELLSKQSTEVGTKADRLAEALKGDNKLLGNWGELSLQRLLETSGLENGRDFRMQVSHTGEEGRRYQPDAIVYLPENRCIVVDSKMSLKSYMDYCNADDNDQRDAAARQHVSSVDAHIKNLSGKQYEQIPDLQDKSPDFVLLFVPSEPALALAMTRRPGLMEDAARANIILTGPAGLLSTLRLIAMIWRQNKQTCAINDIFEAVRKIYEKYVGFAEDMQRIDDQLVKAREAYAAAHKKLATGDGNLLRQMDKFSTLIKSRKNPPAAFLKSQDTPPGDTP